MHITDTVADMLTRIRNANSAKHDTVDIPASNMKKAIARILLEEGYIKSYTVVEGRQTGRDPYCSQIRPQQDSGYLWSAQSFQTWPAHLHQLRGHAPRYEGPGHCDPVHF